MLELFFQNMGVKWFVVEFWALIRNSTNVLNHLLWQCTWNSMILKFSYCWFEEDMIDSNLVTVFVVRPNRQNWYDYINFSILTFMKWSQVPLSVNMFIGDIYPVCNFFCHNVGGFELMYHKCLHLVDDVVVLKFASYILLVAFPFFGFIWGYNFNDAAELHAFGINFVSVIMQCFLNLSCGFVSCFPTQAGWCWDEETSCIG